MRETGWRGAGNTDPRARLDRSGTVLFDGAGAAEWIDKSLEERYELYGKLSSADLADVW